MPPKVPPEIVDVIIDHLHADSSYLAVCSLVCRAWVSASRYHLISTLWIRADTAARCFRLLQSPLCTLSPYVRHLRMYDHRFYPDTVVYNPKGLALPKLVAVETLFLHGMQWPARNKPEMALISGFRNVRDLEICNSWFKTGADVLDFMNAFPLLKRLVLNGNEFRRGGPVTLHGATKMGQARAISLYLKSIMNHELFILYNILLAFGPLLTDLQLGPPAFLREVPEEWSLLIDLSQNTQMRSLTFDRVGHDQWTPNLALPSVEWMLRTVATLKSSHLEIFKITIVTGDLYSMGNMGLGELDRMIADPPFVSLKEVELSVLSLGAQFPPAVAKDYIACHLPRCHKKGILLVNYALGRI